MMKKVTLNKLPQDGKPNTYLLTLFVDGRAIRSETIDGLSDALIKGKQLAKKENADYEQRI